MKKLFTLALLMLGLNLGTADAQERKTWDFTQGISDETIADLKADANWTVTTNDDGSFKQANEATKLSGPFMANGKLIQELEGLSLGTAGLSKNNNVIIFPNKFRLNRNNSEIIFPQLRNGQTITIVGRSANSTAENRGIKAAYDYMQLIEGPEDCLIKASLGEVTLKWQVVTSETEPVDIKFKMITGGVDFSLFMIDEGDAPETTQIAYLYNGMEEDQMLNHMQANELFVTTPIDVTTSTITAEQLQGYDVTIVGAGMPADNAAAQVVKEAMPWTPVLNLNADLYTTWGYGEPIEVPSVIVAKNTKDKLFADITFNDAMGFNAIVLNDDMAETKGLFLNEYFAGDPTPAATLNDTGDGPDDNIVAIHTHNIGHNGYIYLPYTENYTADGFTLFNNAINLLKKSKSEITPASAPTINRVYKDKLTLVAIKAPAQPKARVFYTTDGSDPTTESTLYTDTIKLTEPCTLKAAAIAEGYTLSNPAQLEVLIKEQPKTPVITAEMKGKETIIKIACESEDADIWYNFTGEVDTLKSTKYVDTIAVVITMPQNVTAFAVAGGEVFSEAAYQRVLVEQPRVVIDVAAHFNATQWTADNNPAGLTVANGKGMFSWGASAASMYTGEGTPGTDPQTGDEITIYTDEDLREPEVVNEPGENPEWKLVSRGTCLIWQNLGAQTTNFGDDSNYNPLYSTDVDSLFPVTKNDIQFYKFYENEPGNGSIASINKYQAPLDVVVLANMSGGPLLVQVSTDEQNWQTIGTIEKNGYSRLWSKFTCSYDGTDEVFVRVTEEVASSGPKVFDIYIANQGEKSNALLEELQQELTGIHEIAAQPATTASAGIYRLNGVRLNSLQRGLNIVVGQDGQVRKVMMK
ncbi:MAG: chitobiase/beta-hexosaminidase C-terminal domain-containing protein [Prevotella sp.]|nr:chitobiase/beta-hexosaminidase C-terminal domain-containing protein [Prevotella sp.]